MSAKFFGAAVAAFVLAALPAVSFAADYRADGGLSSLFRGLDLYAGATVKDGEEPSGEGKEREVKADAGAAVRFRDLDLVLSFGLPYTAASSAASALSPGLLWEALTVLPGEGALVARHGLCFRTDAFGFPYAVELSCGSLRFSGSLSRLKRPCLSSPWNYGSLTLLTPGLSASLPTFTSSAAPTAFAVSLHAADRSSPLPALELALLPGEGESYLSVHEELHFSSARASVLCLAVNGAAFVYGGKESSSWFYKEPFYREDRYLSADAEAGFRLEDLMSVNLAAGASENPHGGLEDSFFWRRGQAALSFGFLGLTASHFFAETPDMILPGGSRLNQRSRLSLNPSVKLPVRFPGLSAPAGTLSLALLGMKDVKLKDGVEQDSYTHGIKAAWKFRRLTLSGQYTDSFPGRAGEDLPEEELPEEDLPEEGRPHVRKLGLGLSYRGRLFSSSSSLSFKRDGEKDTLSFSQKLSPASGILESLSLGLSRNSGDDGQDRYGLSAGAVLSFRSKYTNFRGKLLYSSTFYGEF